jgi:hypothetical protein
VTRGLTVSNYVLPYRIQKSGYECSLKQTLIAVGLLAWRGTGAVVAATAIVGRVKLRKIGDLDSYETGAWVL